MDQQVKTRWVEALRSGEYEQGAYNLRAMDRFCCLGVLCDLLDPTGWAPKNEVVYEHRGQSNYPELPVELSMDVMKTLAYKNDNDYTFEMIADYIERHI